MDRRSAPLRGTVRGGGVFDWNDIRIFLMVADEGSTLGAAKKLNMNQTTVSRRMHALEHALGLKLFDRDTRGYALTSPGKALMELAARMGDAAEQLSLRAKDLARGVSGTIKVSAAYAAMNHWVLPLLSQFRKLYPEVNFETCTRESYVSLESGEADIAFRAADKITGDTLIVKRLPPVIWGVYCSRAYLKAHGMPRSIDEMGTHPSLVYPDEMMKNVALLRWLALHTDCQNILGQVDSVVTMSASLQNEQAVGAIPCMEGDPIQNLVRCFTHEKLAGGFWLVASKAAYQKPHVRKFMAHVTEFFPRDAPAIE